MCPQLATLAKMQFTAHCKRKRCNFYANNSAPFPTCDPQQRHQGVFTGLCVEVANPEQIKNLYENGCYGKGSRSRGAPTADEKLLLGLEESCFLAYYIEVLVIKDLAGNELNWQAYLEAALQLNERFIEYLASYLYLKSKNWVIKSGIKFGGEFLVYKQSPRHYHASFLVVVNTPDDTAHYIPKNLKGLQRVAETSDKDVLLLIVEQSSEIVGNYATPESLEACTVKETVIRRFNYTNFVQSKQQQ